MPKCRSREFTKPFPELALSVSPLPWGEVGFTHTNDLVPPKTCCLESWPHSTLSCMFDFLPALIFFFGFFPSFLPAMRLSTTSFPLPSPFLPPLSASINAITTPSLEGKGEGSGPCPPFKPSDHFHRPLWGKLSQTSLCLPLPAHCPAVIPSEIYWIRRHSSPPL